MWQKLETKLAILFVCTWLQTKFQLDFEHFKLAAAAHSCNTRSARSFLLLVPVYSSVRYGGKSSIYSATLAWNHLQNKLKEYDFLSLSPKSLKTLLLKFYISTYDNYWYKVGGGLLKSLCPLSPPDSKTLKIYGYGNIEIIIFHRISIFLYLLKVIFS